MKIDLGKKNLTTPKAILFGLGLIALAIASVPYSSQIIKPAFALSPSNQEFLIFIKADNRKQTKKLTEVIKKECN